MEAERAHSSINKDATATNAIRVLRAFVAPDLRFVILPVYSSVLTIKTRVLTLHAEDGLGYGVDFIVDPAEMYAFLRILIHWHCIDKVEVGYNRDIRIELNQQRHRQIQTYHS